MSKNKNLTYVGKARTPKPKKRKPKQTQKKKATNKNSATTIPSDDNNVGYVFIGKTMFIDPDTKNTRRYLVLKQKGEVVRVGKLKSIKQFDENNKNADPYLVEINQNYKGLTKRTGVDKSTFARNIIKNQPLKITDRDVFNQEPEFRVSMRDLRKAQIHTEIKKVGKSY
jgi:hypothetical protein